MSLEKPEKVEEDYSKNSIIERKYVESLTVFLFYLSS